MVRARFDPHRGDSAIHITFRPAIFGSTVVAFVPVQIAITLLCNLLQNIRSRPEQSGCQSAPPEGFELYDVQLMPAGLIVPSSSETKLPSLCRYAAYLERVRKASDLLALEKLSDAQI